VVVGPWRPRAPGGEQSYDKAWFLVEVTAGTTTRYYLDGNRIVEESDRAGTLRVLRGIQRLSVKLALAE